MDLETCAKDSGIQGALQLANQTEPSPLPPAPPAPVMSEAPLVTPQANTTVAAWTVNTTVAPVGPTAAPFVPAQVPVGNNGTISGAATAGASSLVLVLAGFLVAM